MAEKSVSSDSLAMTVAKEYKGKKFRVAFIGCGGISTCFCSLARHLVDRRRVKPIEPAPSMAIFRGIRLSFFSEITW